MARNSVSESRLNCFSYYFYLGLSRVYSKISYFPKMLQIYAKSFASSLSNEEKAAMVSCSRATPPVHLHFSLTLLPELRACASLESFISFGVSFSSLSLSLTKSPEFGVSSEYNKEAN